MYYRIYEATKYIEKCEMWCFIQKMDMKIVKNNTKGKNFKHISMLLSHTFRQGNRAQADDCANNASNEAGS